MLSSVIKQHWIQLLVRHYIMKFDACRTCSASAVIVNLGHVVKAKLTNRSFEGIMKYPQTEILYPCSDLDQQQRSDNWWCFELLSLYCRWKLQICLQQSVFPSAPVIFILSFSLSLSLILGVCAYVCVCKLLLQNVLLSVLFPHWQPLWTLDR